MFCSECGKQVADDAKFCGECGTVQSNVEQTPKIKVEEVTTRNKLQASVTSPSSGKSSRVGIFLLWTVIVVAALFALKHFQKQTETAQSNQVESGNKENETESSSNVFEKGSDDVALECVYKEYAGKSIVLIYSPKYSVAKYGPEEPNGTWNPEARIDSKESDASEITFHVTAFDWLLVERLNPSAQKPNEIFRVNRTTLDANYYSDGSFVISQFFKCDVLSPEKFKKHVQWVLNNTQRMKEGYKIN